MAHGINEPLAPAKALTAEEMGRIVREKMEVIQREGKKIRESLSRIQHEIDSLWPALRLRKVLGQELAEEKPEAGAASGVPESEPDASDEERGEPKTLSDGSKWSPELRKMVEESFSRRRR